MCKSANGVVVPIPTFPLLSTIKFVAVEDPTTNLLLAAPATGFTAKVAHGEVVPTPTNPALLTINCVVVAKEATLESWKRGAVALFAPATSSFAKGVVVPIPTLPE